MSDDTVKRKSEHLRIVAERSVGFKKKTTGFEDIELVYQALPEISKDDIDTGTKFLGSNFSAPIMISAMTGGAVESEHINHGLAHAAEDLGLGMGLGSQRAMLEDWRLIRTYMVRDVAPTIFLAGNIGAAQLKKFSINQLEKMVEDVNADALAIHINAAQESAQHKGDVDFGGILDKIDFISKNFSKPVYVKEVGHGISAEIARILDRTKVQAIDVQGAGGTSWIGIDSMRGHGGLGDIFWDYGIPTSISTIECRTNFKGQIVASGGIYNGYDAAKAIALGADLVSLARPVFLAQIENGYMGVMEYLEKMIEEFKTAMFLSGAKNVEDLKRKPLVISGRTRQWLIDRGIDPRKYSSHRK
jgi:isopentenyl-diphosphate Delta-isomerase